MQRQLRSGGGATVERRRPAARQRTGERMIASERRHRSARIRKVATRRTFWRTSSKNCICCRARARLQLRFAQAADDLRIKIEKSEFANVSGNASVLAKAKKRGEKVARCGLPHTVGDGGRSRGGAR